MMQRFQGMLLRLWLHMQLLQRRQALRGKGLRVKKRSWLLVIEGKQPQRSLRGKALVPPRRKLQEPRSRRAAALPLHMLPSWSQ